MQAGQDISQYTLLYPRTDYGIWTVTILFLAILLFSFQFIPSLFSCFLLSRIEIDKGNYFSS